MFSCNDLTLGVMISEEDLDHLIDEELEDYVDAVDEEDEHSYTGTIVVNGTEYIYILAVLSFIVALLADIILKI